MDSAVDVILHSGCHKFTEMTVHQQCSADTRGPAVAIERQYWDALPDSLSCCCSSVVRKRIQRDVDLIVVLQKVEMFCRRQ